MSITGITHIQIDARQIEGTWPAEWRVFIKPRGPQDFEGGDSQTGAILAPYGDSFWPTIYEACQFIEQVVSHAEVEPEPDIGRMAPNYPPDWVEVSTKLSPAAVAKLSELAEMGGLHIEKLIGGVLMDVVTKYVVDGKS